MDIEIASFLKCGALIAVNQESLLVGWGSRQWLASPAPCSFYFPNYFLTEPSPWFTHQYTAQMSIEALKIALDALPIKEEKTHRQWKGTSQKTFEESVGHLFDLFSSGVLTKAVPYINERAEVEFSPSDLLRGLRGAISYAKKFPFYLYGFWEESSGLLGATPETLFEYASGTLTTMACAGTQLASHGDRLQKSPKDLQEHAVVVEGIRTSLASYGRVGIGERKVAVFGKLAHLITSMQVEIGHAVPFQELVASLHPTPALGAFPKVRGWQWLLEYEKSASRARARYGAPVGYVNEEASRCYVAIRNVQWDKKGVDLFAGCGIVAASDPTNEWAELQMKLQAIKEVLDL